MTISFAKVMSLAFAIVLSFATIGPGLRYNTAYASTITGSPDCTEQVSNEMHSNDSLIDKSKAITLATQDKDYLSRTQTYTTKFHSVFNIWKLDTVNCHATELQSINVVYNLYDASQYVKNVVVTLDPTLSRVLSVSEYVGAFYTPHSDSAPNWAGKEYTGASFTWPTPPSSPNVWESKATWTEPSVSVPTDPTNACRTDLGKQPCDLAIWTGLEDQFGAGGQNGNGHLVQAGSDGKITCNPGCTTSYFLWYQVGAGNPATICSGSSFTSGHGVQAIVTNQAKTGGSPWLYNLSVIDTSTAVGCSTTGVSYTAMQSPTIAAFINERAKYNPPNYATLAKFSSDAMTGTMYYNGASVGISTPQGQGWYNQWRMYNSVVNIDYPSVSGNTMTFTWSTSQNT